MPVSLPGRFLLGVNYWSRAGGPRMWERFDGAAVRRELAQMKAIGLDCFRCFVLVPSFAPEPPAIAREPLAHFRTLLDLAAEIGLGVLATALVGHMSGENFDFAGQAGRSLYRDQELLAWQQALVSALAAAGKQHPALLAWVLTNEMPLWAGTAPAAEVADWTRALVAAVREHDQRPIGIGDGALAGFPTRATQPLVDYVGPHLYYADSDPLRQAFHTDLTLRAHRTLDRAVLLEEFGCSATQAGEPEQAAYYREVLHAAFAVGARGALGWCYSDFGVAELGSARPYSHHGFELGFGITTADGREKLASAELRRMRGLLDQLGPGELVFPRPRTAVLRSSYLDESYPFSWEDRDEGERTLLEAFVLACQAGLDPEVVSEGDDFAAYRLLICPATQKLRVETWQRLLEAARAGSVVYWSYFSGDQPFHQGAWCPLFGELTGLRHRLRYGCFDLPPALLELEAHGISLTVPTGVESARRPYPLAWLPIELLPGAAVRVLGTDGEGRPALTAHELGRGRVVFLAYPLERYLARRADGSFRDAHRLYAVLGDAASVLARYPTRHPHVQSRVVEQGRDDLVLVQHRGWADTVDDATDLVRHAEILSDSSGRGDGPLGPKDVRVYRVRSVRGG